MLLFRGPFLLLLFRMLFELQERRGGEVEYTSCLAFGLVGGTLS